MVSVRMFSSLLSIMPGVSCIKWWPLIQVIIWNVFVKLGHNHPNHHKSDTRDCSSPGLGIIKSIEFNSFRLLSIIDCKTFWGQDANNNWYEHKSNYWTFKISFDWHQCSASKEKNSFNNFLTERSMRFSDSQRVGALRDFNWEEEGFVIITGNIWGEDILYWVLTLLYWLKYL